MCQLWNQEYSECHHVSSNLIHCPTYYKQQSEANSFLGRLFNGNVRRKKDCGRVIPHHGEPVLFCPACSVKNDRLRGNQVGDGALRVRHPRVRDEYPYYSREHREENENYTERSYRRPGRHAQQGVWIPELYYEPENLAQRDSYCRAAGRARPVSPPRTSAATPDTYKPEQKRDKSAVRLQKPTRDCGLMRHERKHEQEREHEHRHHGSTSKQFPSKREGDRTKLVKRAERKPHASVKEACGFDNPPRSKKPAEPTPRHDRRHRERVPKNKSSRGRKRSRTPSPKRLPPTPPPKDRRQRKWMPQIGNSFSQERPSTAPPPPDKHPQLRRKPGQVYKVPRTPSPPRPPKPPKPSNPPMPMPIPVPIVIPPPIPNPLPEYQVYLNAQRFAANYHPTSEMAAETSTFRPPLKRPPQRSKGLHQHPTLRRIASPLRILDNSSDESFVCRDARLVTLSGEISFKERA
ncbi:uncharacterized protein F4812DRAFT_459455 [Daldinia caldariorum]|uniref:uncharacterized protein n=1 Tax=Daldinia caldariorum TaxID=326644 RepID=UPI0020088A3E|nr:uncharacterized protein F4812DRAFT_459455 [Daldinia caldariorum]KAI1467351.1 hypothetical protein F4812DRAFT_459455 [Daldinia caldariorum]